MESLVFFSLALLIFIRIVGLGVSFEYFLDKKKSRFLVFILGWLIWIIAATLPIIADNVNNNLISESILVVNGIAASLGSLLVVVGIIAYFRRVPVKLVVALSIALITTPVLLLAITGYDVAVRFSSTALFAIIICGFIFTMIGRMDFSNVITDIIVPRRFYLAIGFGIFFIIVFALILTGGVSYGLYQTDNQMAIMLNYFFGIGMTILLVVLMIHFEHNVSYKQKYQLMDTYSHNLGNATQVIMSAAALIGMNEDLSEDNKMKLDLIKEQCKEASDLISEIRKF
ncbi:MAG: hypothetical protein ACXAEU_13180 [Candidatus Hodarchaeales archaeon]|jgi:hypothetical protein